MFELNHFKMKNENCTFCPKAIQGVKESEKSYKINCGFGFSGSSYKPLSLYNDRPDVGNMKIC